MTETLFTPSTNLEKPKYKDHYDPHLIRTAYMPSFRGSDLFFDPNVEPSFTLQQHKDECDINNIIAQYEVTGLLHHTNPLAPMQGDFSEFGPGIDFIAAQNFLVEAQASFDALPAKVRARFQNNPAELLTFLEDPENEIEARKLGLLNPLPETQPNPVLAPSDGKKSTDGTPSE